MPTDSPYCPARSFPAVREFVGLHDGVVRRRSGSQSNPKALAPFFCVVAELSPQTLENLLQNVLPGLLSVQDAVQFVSQVNMAESNQVSTRLFRGGMP
jgi:hypothetical protein